MNKAHKAIFDIQRQMYANKEFLSKSKTNPFYKSKYTPLNDILTQIVPKLHEAGCSLSHDMRPTEFASLVRVVCIITHESGDVYENSMIIPLEKLNGQEAGKAMTYGRRYSLVPLFELPEYDDDGDSLVSRNTHGKETQSKSKKLDPYPHLVKELKKDNMTTTVDAIKNILTGVGIDTPEKVIKATSVKALEIIKSALMKGDKDE